VSYSPCFDNNIEPNAIIQLIIKTYDGSPVPQLNRGADISFMDMNNKRYKQIFVHLDGGLSSITAPSPEDTSDKKKSTSRLKSFLKKNLGFNQ
jgi:hypothetical protein